jgi:hypothetical protein
MSNAPLRDRMRPPAHLLAWLAAFGLVTAFLIWFARYVVPPDTLCADYICYWAAGKALVAGQSPYDVELQTQVQRAHGWDKAKNGLGAFDFLPFYYPPWFAMLCAAVVPLGYEGGRVAWFVVDADLIILSGFLLRRAVPGVPPTIPLFAAPVFIYSIASVLLGQTTPLVFFLVAAAWRLLEASRDRTAGVVLAWLTIKPQMTGLMLLGVLIWAARRRRWGVVMGFLGTLGLLCLASSLMVPGWLSQMLSAPRRTPNPAEIFPQIGTTWFLLLKTSGLPSWVFWPLYALVAAPLLVAVLQAALDRSRPLHDVLALGLLAAAIVAPYGRHYDFPLLLVPFLVLLGTRLSEIAGTALLVALLALPYLQYVLMAQFGLIGHTGRPNPEFLFAWIPLLLAATWWASSLRKGSRPVPEVLTSYTGGMGI